MLKCTGTTQVEDVGDDLVPGPAGGGQDRLGVELHRPPSGLVVLDRHHHAVAPSGERSAAVTSNPPRTSPGGAYRLWYRPAVNSAGSPASSEPPATWTRPGLPCAGSGSRDSVAARVLHHRLQAQADAEDRQVPRVHLVEQRGAAEVGRPPRPGRHDHQVRRVGVEQVRGEAEAQRGHLGAVLAEVVAQRVHERVLVVNQQDPGSVVDATPRPGPAPRAAAPADAVPGRPRPASPAGRAP